jgi:hypothetical protein
MEGTGHTLEVTNSCFLDNILFGAGPIVLASADILMENKGTFASKDEGLNCVFAAVVDEGGSSVSCINSDSQKCFLTAESSSANSRNGSRFLAATLSFLVCIPVFFRCGSEYLNIPFVVDKFIHTNTHDLEMSS